MPIYVSRNLGDKTIRGCFSGNHSTGKAALHREKSSWESSSESTEEGECRAGGPVLQEFRYGWCGKLKSKVNKWIQGDSGGTKMHQLSVLKIIYKMCHKSIGIKKANYTSRYKSDFAKWSLIYLLIHIITYLGYNDYLGCPLKVSSHGALKLKYSK